MSDGVPITAGSGTTVATDDRTEGHVQEMFTSGGTTIDTSRYSATTTSGEAVAARARRAYVTIRSLSTNTATVDIGESGVASGSGWPLDPGEAQTLYTTGAVHADAATGTQVLAILEVFDA